MIIQRDGQTVNLVLKRIGCQNGCFILFFQLIKALELIKRNQCISNRQIDRLPSGHIHDNIRRRSRDNGLRDGYLHQFQRHAHMALRRERIIDHPLDDLCLLTAAAVPDLNDLIQLLAVAAY